MRTSFAAKGKGATIIELLRRKAGATLADLTSFHAHLDTVEVSGSSPLGPTTPRMPCAYILQPLHWPILRCVGAGLAVYVSEKMGADALRYLGSPGKKLDDVTRSLLAGGKLVPLEELLTFTDIGPLESRPGISYPEAASFVKYLLEFHGPERFRRTYRELGKANDRETLHRNKELLSGIYGKTFSQLETDWLRALRER